MINFRSLCRFVLCIPIVIQLGCEKTHDATSNHTGLDPNLNADSEYLVVFGDIQEYTVSQFTIPYYDLSVEWIQSQIEEGIRIRSLMHVGDITCGNERDQWFLFHNHTYRIASVIPFYSCTGNHDYDINENKQITQRSSSRINEYAHFSMTDYGIVEYYEGSSLENYIARLFLDDNDLYLIALEFGPRKEVLEWVDNRLKENQNNRFILLTHEWLTRTGTRISAGSYAEKQLKGYSSYSTPEEIWQQIVRPNPNVVCVLCGHNGFFACLNSINDAGRPVPQILFNLQYLNNGGNGIIQLWEFPVESDSVRICAYDTINRNWYMPDSTTVSFKYR